MTAPGLYRYFGCRENLVRNVVGDIFTEVAEDIGLAIRTAALQTGSETAHGNGGDMTAKMIAACREFRRWSLNRQGEFGLIFGSQLPGVDAGRGDFADECGRKFAFTFFTLFYELWQRSPFPAPAPQDIDIDARLGEQLERFRANIGAAIPVGARLTFLRCWVKLYGAVSMEVFGHSASRWKTPRQCSRSP